MSTPTTCWPPFVINRLQGGLGGLSNRTKLVERFPSLLSKAFRVFLHRDSILPAIPLRSFCSAVIAPLSLRDCPQDPRILLWFCPGFLYLFTPSLLVLRLALSHLDECQSSLIRTNIGSANCNLAVLSHATEIFSAKSNHDPWKAIVPNCFDRPCVNLFCGDASYVGAGD